MYRKLIINETEYETRVAVLEDSTIVELYIERKENTDIAGNIYKGRIQRVLPGMQAAFVDIGLNQAAFLYVDDVVTGNERDLENHFYETADLSSMEPDSLSSEETKSEETKGDIHIEDIISEGQEILVQVAKSPIGTKGSRVTTHISLPGRFLVLMPTSNHIGVSRRIEDEAERKRLKELVISLRKDENIGYIVRTAAEGVHEDKLYYEMVFLKNIWKTIQEKYKTASVTSLIHQELSVSLRAIRDLLVADAQKLVIDSREGYEAILSFLKMYVPDLIGSVEYYDGPEPIFDAYNLEVDISRALKRKVWLKSGGYIIIEHTEALVAIDVNTGRYVGKHNLEETILKTNLEAVKEIAYQIRLRDIGGIIIIDFIDMEKKSNQEKVFNALKEALQKDRSKTHVLPMSELGLIQMTRKRIRKPLTQILCEPCFYCDGEGYMISRETICHNIYRDILRNAKDMTGNSFTLRVNPEIAELLHGDQNHMIATLEQKIGKQINIYPNSKYHMEEFDIIENLV